jgi:uncharacterized membrane protein YeaQ/YmgE (transglycosylase-associated protein family)
MSQENDARTGRLVNWLCRWYGASILILLVLTLFFGDQGHRFHWVALVSMLSGAAIACWLTNLDKHETTS